MRDSIHDNWTYVQAVDHERRRVVLHTVWPHCEPPEYTDIVFEGVVVHHFERPVRGTAGTDEKLRLAGLPLRGA
jgi:hypothetical protein